VLREHRFRFEEIPVSLRTPGFFCLCIFVSMKFQNPSILYFLFLLLIPVLVHLMRLRRYKRLIFPNVSFLKQIHRETQRIQKLKKWILLLLRMGALAALVLAFAKPYFPLETKKSGLPSVIFFDRSMSTNYRSGNTDLHDRLLSLLHEGVFASNQYYLYDGQRWRKTDGKNLTGLLRNDFRHRVTDHVAILKALKRKFPGRKQVYYFSDGQFFDETALHMAREDTLSEYHFIFVNSEFPVNLSVDTIFMVKQAADRVYYRALVHASGKKFNSVFKVTMGGKPVFSQLLNLDKDEGDTIEFHIEKNYSAPGAQIEITNDPYYMPDNRLYFIVPGNKPKKVLMVGDSIPVFLFKLWKANRVDYKTVKPDEVDWVKAKQYDLLVLYGWKPYYNFDLIASLPVPVIFVPQKSMENDRAFFKRINPAFTLKKGDFILNRLDFRRPFFRDVFEKQPAQSQFPYTKFIYALPPVTGSLISTGEGYPAFFKHGNLYVFTFYPAYPVSDFYQSPLVIPVFYKPMNTYAEERLYFYSGTDKAVIFSKGIEGEEPVKLLSGNREYSVYSVMKDGKTEVYIKNLNLPPGIYSVIKGQDTLGVIAVNENRKESRLVYYRGGENELPPHIKLYKNDYTGNIPRSDEPPDYSRWFILLALLFLLTELLVIKYWK